MPEGLKDVIAGESESATSMVRKGFCPTRVTTSTNWLQTRRLKRLRTCFGLANCRRRGNWKIRGSDGELQAIPDEVLAMMRDFAKSAVPMEALRSGVSVLSMFDPESEDASVEANGRKAMRLTAQTATVVAAIARLRDGKDPVPPRTDLSHAGNFYYMLTGDAPERSGRAGVGHSLILHTDHELNASTFAARVTAATLSDMYSAVTSGIGALKGPLHGGANANVNAVADEDR